MGYLHINNLYKDQAVLMFKYVYSLEKIHGTSSHIAYHGNETKDKIEFFSGGEKYANFIALFNINELEKKFEELFGEQYVVVFGETYGGSQQSMSHTYGKQLKFIAFDVRVGNEEGKGSWLDVPHAHDICIKLGLEFVHYVKIPTEIDELDKERDAPSVQAKRNGISEDRPREGIVIRPLIEVRRNNGDRIIAKHKGEAFKERQNVPKVKPGADLEVLKEADKIVEEWVTPMRLEHVLDKHPEITSIEHTKSLINAMVEDIFREGEGEIIKERETASAIGKKTAWLWKQKLMNNLKKY